MGGAGFLIVMALVLGVMYVMMIRPQRRRQQDLRSLVDSAGVGDDILTNGGIYGTIVQVDGDDVEVEIAKGVSVHMTRQGITAVLPPESDDVEEDEDEDEDVHDAPESEDEEALRKRIVQGG
jgi:preprotein translocase subunit YajC